FALLQRFGIIEDEKQIRGAFAKECPRLALDEISDALLEHGQTGRWCYSLLLPKACCLIVQGIDDRSEYETRPVVVELDKPATAARGEMKIPSTEEADLRSLKLRDRRRRAQGRRVPDPAGGNAVKGMNEIGYFRQYGGGDDLIVPHHREFLRHPGSPQLGVEVLGMHRVERHADSSQAFVA